MPIQKHEIGAAAPAFVGSFGGLAAGLAHMTMIDALNEFRPPEDQIPIAIMSWSDLLRREARWREFGYWRIAKQFHARFPDRAAYYWLIGGQVWLFAFVAAGLITLWALR